MALEIDPRAKLNQELYRRYRDARSQWDTEARTDLDFALGNHFTASEEDELASRNQAAVPMDRCGPAIEKLKSVLTSRSPIFNPAPREDSDVKMSKVWRTILGYVWDISDGDEKLRQAIHDYSTTGLGYLYIYVDRNSDFGRGDVKLTYISPFRVYVPPSSRDRWYDDADNVILSTIITKERVISLYPELGEQIDQETGEPIPGIIEEIDTYSEEDMPTSMQSNTQRIFTPAEVKDLDFGEHQRYQILERFYKVKVPFYRVVEQASGKEMLFDEEMFALFLQENPGIFERGLLDFEEIWQDRVAVSASIGQIFLYEDIMSTDIYPLVSFPNIWTGTPYPKSDISRARPIQRLLNKLWSLVLSHAQSSAGLKLIVPVGFALNGMEDLEQRWANPNAVIEGDSSAGEPHFPQPQPLAGEFYRLIQQCEFYIDFTFGLPEMMHGFSGQAPETVRGTQAMLSAGAERPKSKLRDVQFSLDRAGRVAYQISKGHYTFEKMFRLAQPNNDMDEVMVNFYDDVTNTITDIKKDKFNLGQHDIRVEPGSTLPSSKWAELDVYMQAFQMGIIDNIEVLKKFPDIFDKQGVIQRKSQVAQLGSALQQAQQQIKSLQGQLQSTTRESISDKKRVQVEKFKSRLFEVLSDAEADRKVQVGKLVGAVKVEGERLKSLTKDVINESSQARQ
jgi:hypothetical protein|tara:strand:- start:2108 stop:4138 length:2031 start_codon:yes stop_codon:yes gene_type:complete